MSKYTKIGIWYLVLGQNFVHQIGKPSTKYQIPTAPYITFISALLVYTLITSRRYSGVSADVVSGLAVLAASSPTTVAAFSSIRLPIRTCSAAATSSGAGLTAVMATRAASIGPPFCFTATATPARG